jgi:polar amino acid transport system substrate-binding protein
LLIKSPPASGKSRALMFVALDKLHNQKLKQAGPPFSRGTYVIGLRKGDDALKAEVDKAIERIIVDGTLEKILRKWKLWNDAQVEFQTSVKTKTPPAVAFEMTNSSFNWGGALWRLTQAALVTVLIALGSMVIAVVLGLPLAVGQWNGPRWLRILCTIYVEFFRGTPVLVDEWGVDVVVSGSQKALMTPPGLAFVAASERAWAISE